LASDTIDDPAGYASEHTVCDSSRDAADDSASNTTRRSALDAS